ncbi:MAG TPA: SCP2 sterol-binding domain-containing protein [Acidimicrobiales bacterium]|jgi:hypothetical protein|nr:SCP2 sterol-binding domain-containing protein [Acidimicrobiales bacterium]|tara:strand:- start:879 stop:1256 length:378 start_codon:yes stop_codon:yes gene_type:complete
MQFLGEDFVSKWGTAQRPGLGTASGLVVIKVDGGPDGKISVTLELSEGLIVSAYLGSGRGRDLELTMPYELAVELFLRQADPAAEYMKGRLKMSGDMKLWLDLLPLWRKVFTDGGEPQLAGETSF